MARNKLIIIIVTALLVIAAVIFFWQKGNLFSKPLVYKNATYNFSIVLPYNVFELPNEYSKAIGLHVIFLDKSQKETAKYGGIIASADSFELWREEWKDTSEKAVRALLQKNEGGSKITFFEQKTIGNKTTFFYRTKSLRGASEEYSGAIWLDGPAVYGFSNNTLGRKPTIEELTGIVTSFSSLQTETSSGGVNNGFEVTTVKPGDRVGTMTIVSIKPFTDKQPLGKYNAIVQFKGETAITGSWDRREFGGDKVCMSDFSAESKKRLPVQDGDTRAVWFCFDNDAMARTSFGSLGASGTATVIIDDYQYVSADADVWNSARLMRVIEKTTGKSSSAQ